MKNNIFVLSIILIIINFTNNLFSQTNFLKIADDEFNKKNYTKAKKNYLEAIEKEKDSSKINEIKYKIGLCICYLKEDEVFLDFINEFRNNNKNNIWEARSYYLEGLIQSLRYTYSQSSGAEAFDEARYLLNTYYRNNQLNKEEIIKLDAILVDKLEPLINRYYSYYDETKDENYENTKLKEKESLDSIGNEYNKEWETRKKIVFLYKELMSFFSKDLKKYYEVVFNYANFLRRNAQTDVYKKEYIKYFTEIIDKSKDNDLVSKSIYILGLAYQEEGNYVIALDYYNQLLKNYKNSKWVNDAKANIQEIKKPYLNVKVKTQFYLSDTVKFKIEAKNVQNIHFKLIEINLYEIINNYFIENDNGSLSLHYILNNLSTVLKYKIRDVFEWDYETKDKKDFNEFSEEIIIPDRIIDGRKGQYLLIASGNKILSHSIIIITDLMLLTKTENGLSHSWLVRASNGEIVKDGKITSIFTSYDKKIKIFNSYSNNYGKTEIEIPPNYNNQIVIATLEKDFTATNNFYLSYYYRNYEKIKKYTITDRPVYRPNQTVYFKHIIKMYEDGIYLPLKNKLVKLIIRDSRYQEVYKKDLITNDYGSIADKYVLPEDAPLGLYNFSLLIPDLENYENYTQSFRVEEYKRPEYKVNIESITEKLKLGQNIKIKISAKYYFGAPVENGDVEYTVKKARYRHSYYPSTPFDWLYPKEKSYRYRYWWYYDRKEEIVETGIKKLNNEGFIVLNYETESLLKDNWDYDYEYFVEAKVIDASRRAIDASKSIIIPRKEFSVFIKNERGFLTTNENAKFTFYPLTNNNEFKNAKGTLKIYLLELRKDKKSCDTLLIKTDLLTITKGKNIYQTKFKESGKYKIEFITFDVDSEKIVSSIDFYVIDRNFSNKPIYFDKLELIPDKDTYFEGDTLNLLINSEIDSPNIWLSFEADHKIIDNKIIKLNGKSEIIKYIISKKDVPNLFIKAYLVNKNIVYQEETQIFVPPDRQIISVDISTSKEKYQTNEKVILKIKTKDYKGDPIKSEVCLSVYDISLLYIQELLIQDIKKYFYGMLRNNYIQTIISNTLSISEYNKDNNTYIEYKIVGYPDGYFRISKFLRYLNELDYLDYEPPAVYIRQDRFNKVGISPNESIQGEGEVFLSRKAEDDNITKKNGSKAIQVRENFFESLFWNPFIETNEKGEAEISFNTNDALTEWRIDAKAISSKSEVGESNTSFITTKNFIVRLQTPRFLQEKDEVTISAILNNYSNKKLLSNVKIEFDEKYLTLLPGNKENYKIFLDKEGRIDWRFKVNMKGTTDIVVKAESGSLQDAMKITLPILEYGSKKIIVINDELSNNTENVHDIIIPEDIRKNSQSLEVILNPSLATVVLSALPYLVEYPYGCFEQTLNRFIPLTVVNKTLNDLKINLSEIEDFNQKINKNYLGTLTKLFDKKEISKIIYQSLPKIYEFQNSDGGFSWWKGEESDIYMTALGVSALTTAIKMGLDVRDDVLDLAVEYLKREVERKEMVDNNQKAYILYAISCWDPEKVNKQIIEELFKLRDHLSYYSISLLGLTYKNIILFEQKQFDRNKVFNIDKNNPIISYKLNTKEFNSLKIILENLLDRVKVDSTNNTAFWKPESNYFWWRWYNDRIETSATILRLINSVDPNNSILPKVVRWLINNRKGNTWYSTKDSGLLIEILMEYLKTQGELDIDCKYEVYLDNKKIKEINVNKENIFTFNNKILVDDISTGKHNLKIMKSGKGNLFYSVKIDYFSKEDEILPVGNEIYIQREYFKLKKKINNNNEIEFEEIPIKNLDTLMSGDEIRVKLYIESKNDYEYLVFEDRKPSGAEFKLIKSWGGYMEFRDEKAVFFKNYLPQGKTVITYDIRAEIPGVFNVMPSLGYAMYVPEIFGNSSSIRIKIIDKK